MKKIILAGLFFSMVACTSSQLNQALNSVNKTLGTENGLSTLEVVEGLKQALINGITNGSSNASQLDGFFKNPKIKIPFPEDVQKVETRLRQLGAGDQVDKFVMTLNRGAEEAAKEAKPIFIEAIKNMSIEDAWGILKGSESAATDYLRKTTSAKLYEKFHPVVVSSLNKVSATKYYGDVINTYNRIPLVEKVNPDLNDYATNKAMDGLFLLIADEEKKIRENPAARTTELLKKVFGYEK
jgi:hypothetical protein